MEKIYSVGHSTLGQVALLKNLKRYSIQIIVDVRSRPYSRYAPQFNKEELVHFLLRNGIQYKWAGEYIGGLDKNIDWDEGIRKLIRYSENAIVCVMCSEGDPKKCHRYQKIDPSLKANNIEMIHILTNGEAMKINSLF